MKAVKLEVCTLAPPMTFLSPRNIILSFYFKFSFSDNLYGSSCVTMNTSLRFCLVSTPPKRQTDHFSLSGGSPFGMKRAGPDPRCRKNVSCHGNRRVKSCILACAREESIPHLDYDNSRNTVHFCKVLLGASTQTQSRHVTHFQK